MTAKSNKIEHKKSFLVSFVRKLRLKQINKIDSGYAFFLVYVGRHLVNANTYSIAMSIGLICMDFICWNKGNLYKELEEELI
jgi:hypothetical protein